MKRASRFLFDARKTRKKSSLIFPLAACLLDIPDIDTIAKELHVSISTIRIHLKHIYRKTDMNRQLALFYKIAIGPIGMMMKKDDKSET